MRSVDLLLALAAFSLLATASYAGEETIVLKEGAGRDLTAARCASCHSLDYIPMVAPAMNGAAWEKSVRKMIDAFGAPVDEQDAARIVTYLSEQYASAEQSRK